jgi:hypothetical protein
MPAIIVGVGPPGYDPPAMEQVVVSGPRGLRLQVSVPTRRCDRARGLLGRERLEPGEGLLLEQTRSIHTVGMRVPIAAVFLDRERRVVAVVRAAPGRLLLPRRGARHVLECAVDIDVRPGDRLVVTRPRDRSPGS